MSAHAYTEDQLVEQPAIGLLAELGWTTVSALEEIFGATGTLLRETKGEVVLVSRLRAALERLNPALPPEAITAASISENGQLSPRGEILVLSEMLAVKGGPSLNEWLPVFLRKSFSSIRFLFE
jgi:type I site-specific restriction-modification system R (restriction) subunit